MVDCVSMFKYVVKSVGVKYGIIFCFMVKFKLGFFGNSGYMYVFFVDKDGKNLLVRDIFDENVEWKDIEYFFDIGCYFLVGFLEGILDVMFIFVFNINLYKCLVENFWVLVIVFWGLEYRVVFICLIGLLIVKFGVM